MPKTSFPRLPGRAGFSALEIIVAVAVVALIVGLALPTYRNRTANNRVHTVAETLLADLRAAQQDALTKRVAITVGAERADVACPGGAASYTLVANENVVKRVCLDGDVAWAERPTVTFMFEATGVPSSRAAFAVRSVRTGRTRTVTVTAGGELALDNR